MPNAASAVLAWRRLRAGAVRRLSDPRGWWATSLLMLLAAVLRLPRLAVPHAFVFDETYYAKDAFSLLQYGYERAFISGADALLLRGDLGVIQDAPEFVVHPPIGKWAIAMGEAAFGMDPFGWRIVMALLGIVIVGLLHRAALRLTRMPAVAALAGFFLAIDGMAIVLSRTALLDQTLTFFVLVAFVALLRDRDAYAHTLALREYAEAPAWRRLRPWRLVAIVAITAAFATKWSALWFALAFALLAFAWDAQARRRHGIERTPWLGDLAWLATAALLGSAGYLASWIGWFRSTTAWDRAWDDGGISWLPQPLRAFIHYHQQALNFHVHLTSDHPYKASPYWWPLQLRPTSFFFESYSPGQADCPRGGAQCAAEVLALGNVVIWWTACLTVVGLMVLAVLRRLHRRDVAARLAHRTIPWDALVPPLVGFAAGWVPWLWFHDRTTFTFYSIVFAPFICLLAAQGLTLFATRARPLVIPVNGAWLEFQPDGDVSTLVAAAGPDGTDGSEVETADVGVDAAPSDFAVFTRELHLQRALVAGIIVLLAIAFTVFVYPLWTGMTIPYTSWQMRMWLDSWV